MAKVIFNTEVVGYGVRYPVNQVVELGEGQAGYFVGLGWAKYVEKGEKSFKAQKPNPKSYKATKR